MAWRNCRYAARRWGALVMTRDFWLPQFGMTVCANVCRRQGIDGAIVAWHAPVCWSACAVSDGDGNETTHETLPCVRSRTQGRIVLTLKACAAIMTIGLCASAMADIAPPPPKLEPIEEPRASVADNSSPAVKPESEMTVRKHGEDRVEEFRLKGRLYHDQGSTSINRTAVYPRD